MKRWSSKGAVHLERGRTLAVLGKEMGTALGEGREYKDGRSLHTCVQML